jgi:hypothetical protein
MLTIEFTGKTPDEDLAQLNTLIVKEWAASDYKELPTEIQIVGSSTAELSYLQKNNFSVCCGQRPVLITQA